MGPIPPSSYLRDIRKQLHNFLDDYMQEGVVRRTDRQCDNWSFCVLCKELGLFVSAVGDLS